MVTLVVVTIVEGICVTIVVRRRGDPSVLHDFGSQIPEFDTEDVEDDSRGDGGEDEDDDEDDNRDDDRDDDEDDDGDEDDHGDDHEDDEGDVESADVGAEIGAGLVTSSKGTCVAQTMSECVCGSVDEENSDPNEAVTDNSCKTGEFRTLAYKESGNSKLFAAC